MKKVHYQSESMLRLILHHKLSEQLEDDINISFNEHLNSILWLELWREFDYTQIINP